MNRVLFFILFVCFVQVQCENVKTEKEFGLSNGTGLNKHDSYKTNVWNKTFTDISYKINRNIPAEHKTINKMRKSQEVANRQASEYNTNKDEETATFHPDTILVDSEKVAPSNEKQINLSNPDNKNVSLISFEEAMQLSKHEPAKPVQFSFNLPDVPNNEKIPPQETVEKDGYINLESRKLFVRPANFPNQSLPVTDKKQTTSKTVKKDLSRITS